MLCLDAKIIQHIPVHFIKLLWNLTLASSYLMVHLATEIWNTNNINVIPPTKKHTKAQEDTDTFSYRLLAKLILLWVANNQPICQIQCLHRKRRWVVTLTVKKPTEQRHDTERQNTHQNEKKTHFLLHGDKLTCQKSATVWGRGPWVAM